MTTQQEEFPLQDQGHVTFQTKGRLGSITLNRPRALNALTLAMIDALAEHYEKWAREPKIYGVVMESASERAFCAGADVKALARLGRQNLPELIAFFRAEYQLNWQLQLFCKPHIAFIDGMVMGGGVGISLYGTHRVVTEKASFAMPETGIGLFPDIGASWFLPRLPGAIGLYLGLTGRRIGAADMVWLNLATHYADAEAVTKIKDAIANSDPIDPVIDELNKRAGPGELRALKSVIDETFGPAKNVSDLLERLRGVRGEHENWAEATANALAGKSPLSLCLTFELLTSHRSETLKEALQTEFRVVCRMLQQQDFYEGVRAQLIDKDYRPAWQPETLAAVSDEMVQDMFVPLGEDELQLAEIKTV